MLDKKTINNNKFLIASWLVKKKLLTILFSLFSKSIQAVAVKNHDLEIRINSNNIYPFLYFLQKHTLCQFDCLIDIVCYDTPSKSLRFGIIYNLLSTRYNTRLQLVSKLKTTTALLSTVSIFSGASWMEREILDMYGVYFFLNNDLRRILTDYGFSGNPLKKDFPLSGFLELFYDDNQKRISYQLVEFSQEYRNFSFRLL